MVFVFKNPDAQRNKYTMKRDAAYNTFERVFKRMDKGDDLISNLYRKSELKIISELLDEMKDDRDKVQKYKGGRFTRGEKGDYDKIKGDKVKDKLSFGKTNWEDNGPYPEDLQTLFINIMMYRLTKYMSLDCKLVMSANGKFIYLVTKADPQDLARIAEEEKYTMQLAIGATDLSSLEPCDKNMIPLRKIKCTDKKRRSELEEINHKLKDYFAIIENVYDDFEDLFDEEHRAERKKSIN